MTCSKPRAHLGEGEGALRFGLPPDNEDQISDFKLSSFRIGEKAYRYNTRRCNNSLDLLDGEVGDTNGFDLSWTESLGRSNTLSYTNVFAPLILEERSWLSRYRPNLSPYQ